MLKYKTSICIPLAALLGVFLSFHASAAPKADLWSYWASNNPESSLEINHQDWHQFLVSYVRKTKSADGAWSNRVAYSEVTASDKSLLDAYVVSMADITVTSLALNEQLVYWVNLYNASTVKLILDNYPVDSITDISSSWFSFGPWDKDVLVIEGKDVSLNDIEHRILRPIWKDERLHYVLNCASIGCPDLAAEAYSVAEVERQFDQAESTFVNSDRAIRLEGGDIVLSSIYDWYGVDFILAGSATSEEAIIKSILPLLAEDKISAISSAMDSLSVRYEYDWRLNQVSSE